MQPTLPDITNPPLPTLAIKLPAPPVEGSPPRLNAERVQWEGEGDDFQATAIQCAICLRWAEDTAYITAVDAHPETEAISDADSHYCEACRGIAWWFDSVVCDLIRLNPATRPVSSIEREARVILLMTRRAGFRVEAAA